MEMLQVESKMLASVGWHDGVLFLQYKNGKTYQHPNVNKSVFDDLLASESKGDFVNKYIKPKYPVKK